MKYKTCAICLVKKEVNCFYKRVASKSAQGKVYYTYRAWCVQCGPAAYARLREKRFPKTETPKFTGLEFEGFPIGAVNTISKGS